MDTHGLFAAVETGRRSAAGEQDAQDPGAEFAQFFAEQLTNSSRSSTTVVRKDHPDTAA